MLGLLVGYLRTLQVLVGYTDIRMPCLVACYDDSLGIGEVSDTRVLQAIELVGFGKAQGVPYLVPLHTKSVHIELFGSGDEVLSEKVIV